VKWIGRGPVSEITGRTDVRPVRPPEPRRWRHDPSHHAVATSDGREHDASGSIDVVTTQGAAPVTDIVELTLPVKADLVVLARLTAATVASRANFDIEEIEDLRLAVDELCVSLVQDQVDGRLTLRFSRDEDQIEVEGTFRPSTGGTADALAPGSEALSERILDALVDQHGYDNHDSLPRAWLRKRRAHQQVGEHRRPAGHRPRWPSPPGGRTKRSPD
jgi:hypothetical protein